MTLEDFFTLTEMKGGLTTLLRVNELVIVMQKEKDSIVKNIGEAARQWSTVATTVAATENRQCLDRFIQLDGLCFIDKWLKDVQNFSSDTGNNVVEESILALLRALEKLQVDRERSISSGILMTVKNLLGHSSLKIQDRARALFNGWEVARETDATQQVVQKVDVLKEGGIDISINRDRETGQCSSLPDKSSSHENGTEEKHVEPSGEEKKFPLDCAATSQSERVNEERITSPEKTIACAITENKPSDPVHSSNMSNHVDESVPGKEETSVHHSPEKVGARDIIIVAGADVATTLESGSELDLRKEIDANDQGFCSKNSPTSESRNASQKDNWMDDKGSPKGCKRIPMLDTKEQIEECNADTLRASSGDEYRWGEAKDHKTFSMIENSEGAEKSEEHSGDQDGDSSKNASDMFKPTTGVKDCSVMSKRSDMELDYGMVDPLEVARQVAIEVEREVDCREPSCSSSDKPSGGGGLRQPDSPDSTNRKQSQSIEGPCKKLPTLPNPSPRPLPTGPNPVINAETLSVDREKCIYDMASSHVTEAAHESEANMDKGFSGFDLNQEDCSEDMDRPIQISTPIPVVSASRPAAASGVPNAPLQFEGALGWKGSAATSAFRRIPEGDRSIPMLGISNNNSGQRLDSFAFDLNVAEGVEDKIEDLLSGKQILNSSGFPSGEESSIEAASPRRSERLQLDLNHAGDGGVDALLDWRRDGRLFQNQNGRQSPSQSSSSPSMQPSLRNFDLNLNDQQLFIQDSSSDHRLFGKSFQSLNASRTASDGSVISIMGARVEIKGKDSVPQTLSLPNGRTVDHSMDLNLGRSGGFLGMGSSIPFTHSPVYGFNNLASGSGMPFPSAMYGQPPGGPIPYMVDSRGAPVVPQLMASTSSLPPAFSQPTPFMMSMTAAGTSNGAGPSRHNFDLNSGTTIDGGGNRETGLALRQFFNPSQGRSLDDHMGPQQPPPSTGLGLKRQEPDSGFESYPFNYKHHQPSWK